jgi:hypothetical protein
LLMCLKKVFQTENRKHLENMLANITISSLIFPYYGN